MIGATDGSLITFNPGIHSEGEENAPTFSYVNLGHSAEGA